MKKRDQYETFVAVPALIPARLAFAVLTAVKWILALTCLAVVCFVIWQIAMILNDVSHHRMPTALHGHPRRTAFTIPTKPTRS